MKKIELSGPKGVGKFITVDDDLFEDLSKYRWHMSGRELNYAYAHVPGTGRGASPISMHRLIMNFPKKIVDHIDGDTTNNQRSNLRLATLGQNLANQHIYAKNTSGYKGVNLSKNTNKWFAGIAKQKKVYRVYGFTNKRHAAMAYDIIAKDIRKEFASLNFPNAIHG